ncbi:MAG: amidohydrolase family protein, partial [Thioalkalivibrio sp.]|nr:amidohydrolase family protein [Thioalkalivibrio sp.]
GDGSAPIENAVFVVEDGRFTLVGPAASVTVPSGGTRVDLTGKTVIPALVNAHIHLSLDPAERAEQLRHMAYYGAGTVVSMGLDEGAAAFDLRANPIPDGARTLIAGRGITSPEPGRSEVPFWVTTETEARSAVQELAGQNVDLIKIWVDDRNGQYERLSEPLYTEVIDEAHQHGLKVAAHIFSLEDAKGLLRAGVDMFAHGIRDQDVDDELMALLAERPNVVLIPNLPGSGVAADLAWISTVPAAELAEMQARETDRPAAQASFAIQARNLNRLNEAGMHIAFGTDGSTPWAVHLELEDMVRTGMTPAEVIAAATGAGKRSESEISAISSASSHARSSRQSSPPRALRSSSSWSAISIASLIGCGILFRKCSPDGTSARNRSESPRRSISSTALCTTSFVAPA